MVPSLYFDFCKLSFAFCTLGFVISLPSLIVSFVECGNAYPNSVLGATALDGTESFACASLGGRVACESALCKLVNVLTPILEICHALLLLGGIRKFRFWVKQASEEHTNVNVLAQVPWVAAGCGGGCSAERGYSARSSFGSALG